MAKKITNEDLGKSIKDLTGNVDYLAVMMKKGFDIMDERFAGLETGQTRLETGQEDIKLRLDQAAYRFEMQALEKRVNALEKHTGLSKAKVR